MIYIGYYRLCVFGPSFLVSLGRPSTNRPTLCGWEQLSLFTG